MDLTSSTGSGVALRIKTLALLIIPLLNQFGVPLVSDEVDKFIDAIFVIVFGVSHIYAWIRAHINKRDSLGKFATK